MTLLAPTAPPPAWRRWFDTVSIWITLYSLVCLFAELELDSDSIGSAGWWLWNERVIAAVFTAEYFVRWRLAKDRLRYPITFMAVIDLVSVLPFYLGFFADPGELAMVRVLRIARVLRLYRTSESLRLFFRAYNRCRDELVTVMSFVLVVVLISSTLLFYLEHPVQPDKIAKPSDAVWWCVVTMSTVGYGDIAPVTMLGRLVGVLTVVVGVASYGVFLTLFGGAWIDVLRERRAKEADAQQLGGTPHPPA